MAFPARKTTDEPEKPLIFIVEDNELYSLSLDFGLSHSGNYSIVRFSSGEECIANLHRQPAVILLDFYLEGMNGRQTLREIKKRDPSVPVIMMSNQENVQIAVDLIKEGAYDYIVKSNQATLKLSNTISQLLNVKEVDRENIVLKVAVSKYKIITGILVTVLIAFIVFVIFMSSPD